MNLTMGIVSLINHDFASLPVKSQTPFPSLSVGKTEEGIHECESDNTIKHFLKLYNHSI